ncbi:MAG: alanine-synthesizing transaminase [Lysobacterales bacterium]|jgi:alanine-synthesizing transaminase
MSVIFSERTNWEHTTNDISQVISGFRKDNINYLDLSVSNPTQCGFSYPQGFLADFDNENNLTYSAQSFGLKYARMAVVEYYHAKGVIIDVNQVILTSSTSEAYSYLFRLLLNSYDTVLFPKPSYPLFEYLVDVNDLIMAQYELVYNNQWFVDKDSLETTVNDKTKALVVVNPNNPTGSFMQSDDISLINRVAQDSNLSIISDEVFSDYTLDSKRYSTFVGNKNVLTFVLGGLSKTLAMPQMKLSWIIVSGPDRQVEEALNRLEIIADTYLSVNTPVQNALASWLKQKDVIQVPIKQRVEKNYQWLKSLNSKAFGVLNVDGGWYVILKVMLGEGDFVYDLLCKEHVYVHPGYFYDLDGDALCVVSLLTEENVLKEGIARLIKFIDG